MKIIITFVLIFLYSVTAFCQNDSISSPIKYDKDFVFKDGVYLSFSHFKSNSPVPIKFIISSEDFSNFYFFNNLVESENISYFDKYGMKQNIKTENIWGFCRRGNIFIQINNKFQRIPVIGNICHFLATKNVVTAAPFDPYYPSPSRYYPAPTQNEVGTQYILDTNSGNVFEFELEALKGLIMTDHELYDEYNNLPKRKQRKQMYLYLRKFNERNPLYIN